MKSSFTLKWWFPELYCEVLKVNDATLFSVQCLSCSLGRAGAHMHSTRAVLNLWISDLIIVSVIIAQND